MRKIILVMILALIGSSAFAAQQTLDNGSTFGVQRGKINDNFTELYGRSLNTDDQTSNEVDTSTTNFDNNLSSADDTVQKALDTLDNLSTGSGSVSDAVYGSGWNGDTTVAPSKNAVYDKIETLGGGHDAVTLGSGVDAITLTGQELGTDATVEQLADLTPVNDAILGYNGSGEFEAKSTLDIDLVLADEAPTINGQITLDASNNGIRVQVAGIDYAINGTGGGSSSYVATPWTYSDEACTAGQYSLSEAYHYDCVVSGNINRTALTDWSNPTPTTYSLTVDMVDGNGTDLFTYSSIDYTTDQTFTGLSADVTFTVTADTGREVACTGTGITDNTGGSYTADTDTANRTAECTYADSSGGTILRGDTGGGEFPGNWTVEPSGATTFVELISDDSDSTHITSATAYTSGNMEAEDYTGCSSVSKVTLNIRASAGAGDVTLRPYISGTYVSADEFEVSGSTITTYTVEYTTNPADSGAWECSDLAGSNDFGFQMRDAASVTVYDTWLLAE